MLNNLTFGQAAWTNGVLVAAGVIFLLVVWSYWRAALPLPIKLAAFTLKTLAIGLVLFSLLDPMIIRQRPKSQANFLGIVVDDSLSMQSQLGTRGASEGLSNAWQEKLSSKATWQQNLEDDFRLRRYRIGNRLEAVDDLSNLRLLDERSAIDRSLSLLSERLQGIPTAGVILVSDGQNTVTQSLGEPNEEQAWKDLGFPVFPLVLESVVQEPDLLIRDVVLRQSDFEAAPVTIEATLEAHALSGQKAVIDLLDASGKVVATQSMKLDGNLAAKPVEFRFRPEASGVQIYRIVTKLVNEQSTSLTAATSTKFVERTERNNQRTVVVDRGRGPYRILYLAGRPNWEHKFLRRAVAEDAELEMVSLVRIAKKEPKFSFRDSKVDSANPLFAGFEDVSDEEKEQYNEPVFVRLGVNDRQELQKGFPGTAEELFAYQAIIMDDIEHEFFTADQQSLLRQFVSIRGGGLLFLGGTESMRGKGFRESVLAQILPVYGEERSVMPATSTKEISVIPVRYGLTREGWLEPFLRTADTEVAEKKQQELMPSLKVLNESGGLKPGAIALADVALPDASKKPALVAQRFGKGKSAALLVGDMWRWGLGHQDKSPAPLGQAWRQMIRWLIADVPKPIAMHVEPALASASGQSATIQIDIRTVEFEPKENVDIQIAVTAPDGSVITGKAEPSESRAGAYEFSLLTTQEGGYSAAATITDVDGSEFGSAQVGWVHEPSVIELQTMGTNQSILEAIAKKTGGELLKPSDLDGFADRLQKRKMPITETELSPLWHHGWLLGFILACLGGEWWLRRTRGLR